MRIAGRSVEIDPYYARAWALLAMAQSNLRYAFRCQVDDGYAAAHAAMTTDPTIAEAHFPMVRRLEERRLVNLQPDAVPGAMIEQRSEARVLNGAAGGGIHGAGLHAPAQHTQRFLLRAAHHRVDFFQLGVRQSFRRP